MGETGRVESRAEFELVLMARSQDPQALLGRVAELTFIGEYRLALKPAEKIHDVYFDTPGGALRHHKLNLRIRRSNGKSWITLKRSAGLLTWRRREERRETELPWSMESLEQILNEISRNGVRLGKAAFPQVTDPIESLKTVGLLVLQDRETLRYPREVRSPRDEPVAELAIDSVTYHFASGDVHLDEFEIEAKTKAGRVVVDLLAEQLTSMFGRELQRWKFGKLATGRAIERLMRNGLLKGLVQDGRLSFEAYDRVLDALK